MNLNSFVSQGHDRWQELEQTARLLERRGPGGQNPDSLRRFAQLYRQVSDDLALARSFFSESQVCEYLNNLVAQSHPLLYGRPRQRPLVRARKFLQYDFPQAFRHCRWSIVAAAGLLMLPLLVAYLATLDHPGLALELLPEGLVQSVDNGQMWTESIFSVMPGEVISTQIMLNNIGVTFLVFASGLLAGLGSVALLIYNGIVIGCAAGYAHRGGLGGEFWSFVAGHGFLELMVIAMAGGAGLELGLALVSPGQLTRGQSFRQRGRLSIRLIVGGIPLLVIAGIVEGMISGGRPFLLLGTVDVGKVLMGAGILALVLLYLTLSGRSNASDTEASLAERAAREAEAGRYSRPRSLISR